MTIHDYRLYFIIFLRDFLLYSHYLSVLISTGSVYRELRTNYVIL